MKKHIFVLSSLLVLSSLAGCNKTDTPHTHTFDTDHWEQNITHHWHASTCEHEGLASDLGEHNYNSDGICTICNHQRAKEVFNFTFRSDYCVLNNESIYEEGNEVHLNLTLKEEFKDSLVVPTKIEVFSDGIELIEGSDYTYQVIDDVGKLTLKIKGDTVVQVFRDNNASVFRVNENEFNYAMNAGNYDYIQYDSYTGVYTSSLLNISEHLIEYSPNIVYVGSVNLSSGNHSGNLTYSHTYIENEDSTYTKYISYNDEDWESLNSNVEEFNFYKYINLKYIYGVGDASSLDYNAIKDNFNQVTNAYEFSLIVNEKKYDLKMSFYDKKLVSVSYSSDGSTGYYGGVSVSYSSKDPVIPEEAKPHVHKFSNEWSKDETNHWHEAICEHTNEKSEVGEHIYGDDNICDICGYIGPVRYTITYLNWPEILGNPNPTYYTGDADIIFDLSPIKNMSGFKNVSAKINGQAVPGITHGTTGDIVVEICYTLAQTKIILDPNRGELLPNNSHIYVDFRNGEEPVEVGVPNKNDTLSLNLYDPEVLTVPKRENLVFKGFSTSVLNNTPLNESESEINELRNGSTIYAIWEAKNGQLGIPFNVESLGDSMSTSSVLVPENASKITFNYNVGSTDDATIKIYGSGATTQIIFEKHISEATGYQEEEISVSGYDKLIVMYSTNSEEPYPAFSYGAVVSCYDSLNVRAIESSNPATQTISYLDIFDPGVATREDHTFLGWFDESGKQYEIGKQWLGSIEEVTLYAHYKYNKMQQFSLMVSDKYSEYISQMSEFTDLTESQKRYYMSLLSELNNECLDFLDNALLDYESAFDAKNNCIDSLSRIFYRASEENLNACKAKKCAELETIVMGYLDEFSSLEPNTYNSLKSLFETSVLNIQERINRCTSIDQINNEFNEGKRELETIYSSYK